MGLYDKLVKIHYDQSILKDQEDDCKTRLVEKLGEAPAFLSTEDGKVKKICYWAQTSRTSLDMESLKKDHPEIDFSIYQKTTSTPTFRVTFPRSK